MNDPLGSVSFDIYREGTEGVVNVQWRLSADAVDDFEAPLTGTETFGPVRMRNVQTFVNTNWRLVWLNLLPAETKFWPR